MTQNTVSEIIDVVCEMGGIELHQIAGSRRTKKIVKHRHIAMHLARERTIETALSIAQQLGRRDHTTVLYADRAIIALRDESPKWRDYINEIVCRLDQIRRERSTIACPQVARFPLAPKQPKRRPRPKFQKPSNDDRNALHHEQKVRTCLSESCSKEFLSKTYGDRICPRCKYNRHNKGGFDARLEGATI